MTDQAFIGVEPITPEHTAACNGTYHGKVHVVQSNNTNDPGEGWTFVAAFYDFQDAQTLRNTLKRKRVG